MNMNKRTIKACLLRSIPYAGDSCKVAVEPLGHFKRTCNCLHPVGEIGEYTLSQERKTCCCYLWGLSALTQVPQLSVPLAYCPVTQTVTNFFLILGTGSNQADW